MANSEGLLGRLGNDAATLCRRAWWVFLVGGLAALVFGVLAIFQPVAAWLVVATLFAAAILVDGIFNIAGAIQNRDKDAWWVLLLIGALGVLVGGYALLNPLVSMAAFAFLVALQAIVFGVFLVVLGYKVRAVTEREWLLYLTGALSVLFGVVVFVNPAVGGISVVLVIAAWAIVTGLLRIAFAIQIRRLPSRVASRFT